MTDLPDQEDLRRLYEDDLLSEAAIAARFGTYQVKIGRLRVKYGIPTISQPERSLRRLPPLSETQRRLLIGSLLGDGWMSPSSVTSARFGEGHCQQQAGYTDWKAGLLAPFTSRVFNHSKTDKRTGKVFTGRSLSTTSCPQLRGFYDLFYPAPDHVRVFPSSLYRLITPLALAVWYMDDGSLASGGRNVRIAFGLCDLSLKRAVRALRVFGLKPKVYGSGRDRTIELFGQTRQFLDLVTPHVPECMAYKLPVESPRQKVDRNARVLTAKRSRSLAEGGLTVASIASLYNVGTSTVRRRYREAGYRGRPGPKPSLGSQALAEVMSAKYPDTTVWVGLPEAEQEQWVTDIIQMLRKGSFPFPEHLEGIKEFDKVRGKSILNRSTAGLKLCYPFFPNRYKARYQKQPTAWEAWHEDKLLRRAIRFQLKYGDPVVPARVLRAVSANCRTPSVFRPAVAKYLYDRYCPASGSVWDPCAGYGGRLLGAVASQVGTYVATDVDPETIDGNQRLADHLGQGHRVSLHQCPAETFTPPDVDFVFTSPPYFHREKYLGSDQSWRQYDTLDAWVDGFLKPLLRTARRAVVERSGKVAINIANLRNRKGVIPLEQITLDVARTEGLVLDTTLQMPLAGLHRRQPVEPIFVWRLVGCQSSASP